MLQQLKDLPVTPTPPTQTNDKSRGQSIVEFALVLPVLLALVYGIMEFGRLLFTYSAITTSSREAARYGSAAENYMKCSEIRAAATRIGSFAGLGDADITINYDRPKTNTSMGGCPVGGTGPTNLVLGDRIIVSVQKQFQPILPLVNLPPLTISALSRRTILYGLEVK